MHTTFICSLSLSLSLSHTLFLFLSRSLSLSPDLRTLTNREELLVYLTSDSTCKCGLRCPFQLEDQFSFDPLVLGLPDNGVLTLAQASCKVSSPFASNPTPASGAASYPGGGRSHLRQGKLRNKTRYHTRRGASESESSVTTLSVRSLSPRRVSSIITDTALVNPPSNSSSSPPGGGDGGKGESEDLAKTAELISPTKSVQNASEMSVRGLLSRGPASSSPSPSPQRGRAGSESRKSSEERQSVAKMALRLMQSQKETRTKEKGSPTLSAVLTGIGLGEAAGKRKEEGKIGGGEEGGRGEGDKEVKEVAGCELTISIKLVGQVEVKDATPEKMDSSTPELMPGDREEDLELQPSVPHDVSDQNIGSVGTPSNQTSLETALPGGDTNSNQLLSTRDVPLSPPNGTPPPPQSDSLSDSPSPDDPHPTKSNAPPTTAATTAQSPSLQSPSKTASPTPPPDHQSLPETPPTPPQTSGTGTKQVSLEQSNTGSSSQLYRNDGSTGPPLLTTAEAPVTTSSEADPETFHSASSDLNSLVVGVASSLGGRGEEEEVGRVFSELCGGAEPAGDVDIPLDFTSTANSLVGVPDNAHHQGGVLNNAHHVSTSESDSGHHDSKWYQNGTEILPTVVQIREALAVKQNGCGLINEGGVVLDTSDIQPRKISREKGVYSNYNPTPLLPRNKLPRALQSLPLQLVPSTIDQSLPTDLPTSFVAPDDGVSPPISELSSLTPDSAHFGPSSSGSCSVVPTSPLSSPLPLPSLPGPRWTPQRGEVTIRECRVSLRPLGREWTPNKKSFVEIETLQQRAKEEKEAKEEEEVEDEEKRISEGDEEGAGLLPKRLRFTIDLHEEKKEEISECVVFDETRPVDRLVGNPEPLVLSDCEIAQPEIPSLPIAAERSSELVEASATTGGENVGIATGSLVTCEVDSMATFAPEPGSEGLNEGVEGLNKGIEGLNGGDKWLNGACTSVEEAEPQSEREGEDEMENNIAREESRPGSEQNCNTTESQNEAVLTSSQSTLSTATDIEMSAEPGEGREEPESPPPLQLEHVATATEDGMGGRSDFDSSGGAVSENNMSSREAEFGVASNTMVTESSVQESPPPVGEVEGKEGRRRESDAFNEEKKAGVGEEEREEREGEQVGREVMKEEEEVVEEREKEEEEKEKEVAGKEMVKVEKDGEEVEGETAKEEEFGLLHLLAQVAVDSSPEVDSSTSPNEDAFDLPMVPKIGNLEQPPRNTDGNDSTASHPVVKQRTQPKRAWRKRRNVDCEMGISEPLPERGRGRGGRRRIRVRRSARGRGRGGRGPAKEKLFRQTDISLVSGSEEGCEVDVVDSGDERHTSGVGPSATDISQNGVTIGDVDEAKTGEIVEANPSKAASILTHDKNVSNGGREREREVSLGSGDAKVASTGGDNGLLPGNVAGLPNSTESEETKCAESADKTTSGIHLEKLEIPTQPQVDPQSCEESPQPPATTPSPNPPMSTDIPPGSEFNLSCDVSCDIANTTVAAVEKCAVPPTGSDTGSHDTGERSHDLSTDHNTGSHDIGKGSCDVSTDRDTGSRDTGKRSHDMFVGGEMTTDAELDLLTKKTRVWRGEGRRGRRRGRGRRGGGRGRAGTRMGHNSMDSGSISMDSGQTSMDSESRSHEFGSTSEVMRLAKVKTNNERDGENETFGPLSPTKPSPSPSFTPQSATPPVEHSPDTAAVRNSPSPRSTQSPAQLIVSLPLSLIKLPHHHSLECYSTSQFQPGDVVWAKAPQLPGWPGLVINHSQLRRNELEPAPQGKVSPVHLSSIHLVSLTRPCPV